jgi:hypothetical protein
MTMTSARNPKTISWKMWSILSASDGNMTAMVQLYVRRGKGRLCHASMVSPWERQHKVTDGV